VTQETIRTRSPNGSVNPAGLYALIGGTGVSIPLGCAATIADFNWCDPRFVAAKVLHVSYVARCIRIIAKF
jgi:hypothetical protein